MRPTAPWYWSVRRELWENRSLYLGGPAIAVLILLGLVVSFLHWSKYVQGSSGPKHMEPLMIVQNLCGVVALAIMAATFLVAMFYCLDALYGERRDRSILFWKSLPVSDVTTVLSKASIPLIILPIITFVTTVIAQFIVLIMSSITFAAHGLPVAPLWNPSTFFKISLMLLFHLVAIHGLWYAPIYGWLMLVSAWARRAPFLWALLPILAFALVEKIAFSTTYVGNLLGYRLSGPQDATLTMSGMAMNPLDQIHLGEFLLTPGLWIGLAFAAAFLFAAIQLRRYRGPL
jgi:ABC-2 type transport system permease protein